MGMVNVPIQAYKHRNGYANSLCLFVSGYNKHMCVYMTLELVNV